jgi:hypothetical protein
MIRVGTRIYGKNGISDPSFEGFDPILVLMKSHSRWGELGPYSLKDEKGRIFENYHQFSKIYEELPDVISFYSKYDKTVIWDYSAHKQFNKNTNEMTPEYLKWRAIGMNHNYYARYPMGYNTRHKCLFALRNDSETIRNAYKNYSSSGNSSNFKVIESDKLYYIQARKQIYLPEYMRLVKLESLFYELKDMLRSGRNLLIIEVDGPHEESLNYYKQHYSVDNTFIQNRTMLCTVQNLCIMLNDGLHPFGHGYCLAMALMGFEGSKELNSNMIVDSFSKAIMTKENIEFIHKLYKKLLDEKVDVNDLVIIKFINICIELSISRNKSLNNIFIKLNKKINCTFEIKI